MLPSVRQLQWLSGKAVSAVPVGFPLFVFLHFEGVNDDRDIGAATGDLTREVGSRQLVAAHLAIGDGLELDVAYVDGVHIHIGFDEAGLGFKAVDGYGTAVADVVVLFIGGDGKEMSHALESDAAKNQRLHLGLAQVAEELKVVDGAGDVVDAQVGVAQIDAKVGGLHLFGGDNIVAGAHHQGAQVDVADGYAIFQIDGVELDIGNGRLETDGVAIDVGLGAVHVADG